MYQPVEQYRAIMALLFFFDSIENIVGKGENAGYKFNVAKMMNFVYDSIKNIVGKGENDGYQHFLLSPQFF